MRLHEGEEVRYARGIELPDGAILVAIGTNDDVEVVGSDTTIKAGDTAIVACDSDLTDEVRAILRNL